MKKFLSLALSVLTVSTLLVSCAPAADQLDPAITIASSDAATYAEWLNDRLDTIPDDVVLGIGTNEAYGVDMANFDSDGYIARAIGDEVLLFGKTAAGLDRAVREYAKAADVGATAELDTVYHEGVRINKLTIAGRDISEFSVVYDNSQPEVYNPGGAGISTGNAIFAADEFIRLIGKATGVTLQKYKQGTEPEGPAVMFSYITDGSCGENGFSYEIENGNLYINGAPDANGVVNGTYHFLQYQCGWEGLMFGTSELRETDLVTVEDGLSVTVDPIFDYINLYGNHIGPAEFRFGSERNREVSTYRGIITNAGHGLYYYTISPPSPSYQICYTSEDNFLSLFDQVYSKISNAVTAGQEIGKELLYVDLSQTDFPHYCMCSDCYVVYHKEEGKSHAGAMIRFMNRMAEEMEAENLGGLKYLVFSYYCSNVPPKTAARPEIYVTFCTDGACINHPLRGGECGYLPLQAHPIFMERYINNDDFDEWIRGWTEKCENLYLWHYDLPNNYGNYTYMQNLYDDVMYMKEMGFKGIFLEGEYNGLGFNRFREQLISELIWNPELTEEEYNLRFDEIMEREYGEGYTYIKDFIGILEEAEEPVGCFDCWGYSANEVFNAKNWDTEIFYSRADECVKLLEMAIDLASTDVQEDLIKALLTEVLYRQCAIGYFTAYDAGDTEALAALEEKYQHCLTIGNDVFNGTVWRISMGDTFTPQPTLEDEAWFHWNHERASLLPEGAITSAMPDKWADWYETSETEASA